MADTPDNRRTSRPPRRTSGNVQTPTGRINIQQAPSSSRSIHTPLDRTASRDLASSARRGLSASGGRRNNAPTPHATAAARAISERRTAMFTPGKNRRKSAMDQRETPRDLLRQIGRVLAPTTNVIASSSSPYDGRPSIAPVQEESEGDDDDSPLVRPRFSLPIDQDDDSELLPPEVTQLPEEDEGDYTIPGVELPRRELPSNLAGRYSRGSERMSEYFGNEDQTELTGRQSGIFPQSSDGVEATGDMGGQPYERVDNDTRRITMGRDSDFDFDLPPGMADQTATFMMSEPATDMQPTSPFEAGRAADAAQEATGNITFIPEDPSMMVDVGDYDDNETMGNVTFADPGPGERQESPDEGVEVEVDMDEEEADQTMADTTMLEDPTPRRGRPKAAKKTKRISRHGTPYPPLPNPFVKRVAHRALQSSGLSNTRLSTDVVAALSQASEWFFEQLGDDLGAYADHAKRKTIEESDVITLMRRQRQVTSDTTLFSLAQRHLPRELLQDLRMPVPETKRSKKAKMHDDDDDESDSS